MAQAVPVFLFLASTSSSPWSGPPKPGQGGELGSARRKDEPDEGEGEAIFSGVQGEGGPGGYPRRADGGSAGGATQRPPGHAEADEATREGEIDQIHEKIGQLVVEGDFSVGPPGAERGGETRHDRTGSPTTADHAPMRPGRHQPVGILGRPADRKPRDRCRPPGDRRPVPRDALVRLAVARKRVRRLMARMGLARHLPGAEERGAAPPAPRLLLSPSEYGDRQA